MTRYLKYTLILSLLLCTALPTLALKRAELLPADSRFDIHLSDTISFWDKLKLSPLGKLWADPQFQDFIGNPDEDVLNELLYDGEKTTEDEIVIEQLKMIKGEVIASMDKEEELYVVAAMSSEDFLRSLELDDRLKEVAEEPFDIVRDTFQDVEVIQHITNPGTELESRSWQAHLNNTLIMGPDKEWIEKSIVRLKEESIEEPEGNPVLTFNLPLATLIQEAVAEAAEEEEATQSGVNPTALFESLGLMGIEKFSVRMELKDGEFLVDNNLIASSLDKGIFTILNMQPAEIPSVGFIPENISLLEVGRMDLLRFWQEIPVILMAAMPESKPQLDMALGMIRQQTGIDLEQDLLAHIGNQYLSYSTLENDTLISVIACELRDGQAFKRGLESIMNAPTIQPQVAMALDTVDFLDHTLYVSKNTEPADTISFAVSGNYLFYGQPDGVRQVIRNESSEATANSRFEQTEMVEGLRSNTPDNAFGYSVVDWKKNMTFVIRELSKPQMYRMIFGQWAASGSPIPPPDLSKLPPADHLASFFNTSYQYVEKTSNGLHQRIILKY